MTFLRVFVEVILSQLMKQKTFRIEIHSTSSSKYRLLPWFFAHGLKDKVKWGASTRWLFGPNSAWGTIETTTIGKTLRTLKEIGPWTYSYRLNLFVTRFQWIKSRDVRLKSSSTGLNAGCITLGLIGNASQFSRPASNNIKMLKFILSIFFDDL